MVLDGAERIDEAPLFLHARRSTRLFLDGHCEALTFKEFSEPAIVMGGFLFPIPPWHGRPEEKRYMGW